MNTTGFKKKVLSLQESGKSGGVQVRSNPAIHTQGSLVPTNNPLNIAINGKGLLRIALPGGGSGYTRDGNLKKDSTGRLTTANGNPILPEIVVPGNAEGLSISRTGEVSALINGQNQVLGQLELFLFPGPAGLVSLGMNLLSESNKSGQAINGTPGSGGMGTIIQGSLESSNVDIIEESVNLITAEAGFKANIKTIKAHDELLGTVIDLKK